MSGKPVGGAAIAVVAPVFAILACFAPEKSCASAAVSWSDSLVTISSTSDTLGVGDIGISSGAAPMLEIPAGLDDALDGCAAVALKSIDFVLGNSRSIATPAHKIAIAAGSMTYVSDAVVTNVDANASRAYLVYSFEERGVFIVPGMRYPIAFLNDSGEQLAKVRYAVAAGLDDLIHNLEFTNQVVYRPVFEIKGEAVDESSLDVAAGPVLRISEIMPKPTDDQAPGKREGMDVNGVESGWVELENTSGQWADLKDYRFIRTNRGKKTDPKGKGNFPSRLVPPYSRTVFYTSDRYPNAEKPGESAFEEGTFDQKPAIYPKLNNVLVWGDKVNPKKSPYVRLYHMPDKATTNVVDTVVIPSDVPEGWSIIAGQAGDNEGTRRWLCPTPTRGIANTDTEGLTRIGPNVGPLYEISSQKKTDVPNEFALPVPPAKPGKDYTIMLPVNPVMNPNGTFSPRAADEIASIRLVCRKDLDDTTLTTNDVPMVKTTDKKAWGDQYTATIPADCLPGAGHLIQWKVLMTDGEGVAWTSPSFNNPDDGYEWYGTIVEAPELESAALPTWHMFAKDPHLTQMDRDKDRQHLSKVPNYARIAIYDSSTSNYYDYVRIDLRGNTSAGFAKKGHGLRFAKAHPLAMRDVTSGEDIEEIRKTSLISEFADPSLMRQMTAFWLWRKMGNQVPFDFPVRCNLNGEFYQLAFNSERFTDELIEDVYGLDKYGYSYKNVGTLNSANTTAGKIEKKTPDDENESDISVLTGSLVGPLQTCGANKSHETGENADLTKFVVEKFDLPAWINYLASARITQEMDDVWANLCIYLDDAEMKEGQRGTGTWKPLGYDFNLSLGQWYKADISENLTGLFSTNDWFKSHPLYGGWTIPAHKGENGSAMSGNNGFEAVLQSPKFRRLFLRRLRTLMDQELKAPDTPEQDTPFMAKMREMADLMRADAALDQAKWPNDSTDDAIDVWGDARPADMDAGIDDIWENYIVPRRKHLYDTHSITNVAKAVGYAANLNAGIPLAQSPLATLAPNIAIANVESVTAGQAAHGIKGLFRDTEVCVITNGNAEAVDMSGWKLSGAVEFTLPPGAVCDANGAIFIVCDRRAYIAGHAEELSDEVVIGNAPAFGSGEISLSDAEGRAVCDYKEVSPEPVYSRFSTTIPGCGDWWMWSLPDDAKVENEGGNYFVVLNGGAIEQSLGDLATNAVTVSVLAEIPADAMGAAIGLCLAGGVYTNSVYAYANGDSTFKMMYDDGADTKRTTARSVSSNAQCMAALNMSGLHLWTLAFNYASDKNSGFNNSGMKFYCDGELVASDTGIKWSGDTPRKPSVKISVGNDVNGNYPLAWMKVYGIATSCAYGNEVYDVAIAAYDDAIAGMPSTGGIEDDAVKDAVRENYLKYGITDETVAVNGKRLSFASSAAAIKMFGIAILDDEEAEFNISGIDMADGKLTLSVSPQMKCGTLSVLAKKDFGESWKRVVKNPEAEEISFNDGALSGYRFFQIRAELGEAELGEGEE